MRLFAERISHWFCWGMGDVDLFENNQPVVFISAADCRLCTHIPHEPIVDVSADAPSPQFNTSILLCYVYQGGDERPMCHCFVRSSVSLHTQVFDDSMQFEFHSLFPSRDHEKL